MTSPRLFVGDAAALRARVKEEVEHAAALALAERGRFVIGIPGGSVAAMVFPVFAVAAVDWMRTEIFWIDERAVPPEHPESNYAIALRLFLTKVRAPIERVHRLRGELPDLDQAARQASDTLKSIAGDPPQLDLVLAGVGEDGHVASIFPGHPTDTRDHVVAVHQSPKPPQHRLTMAMTVIANAHGVIIGAFGTAKAAAMRDALKDGRSRTPVAELVRRAHAPLVLLDAEAASLL